MVCRQYMAILRMNHLLDLLRLQLDRLPIDKYALPLVRFRLPPRSDLRRKLHYDLLVRTLQ